MNSEKITDVEATPVNQPPPPPQTMALATRESMAVGQAMKIEDIVAQVELIQTVMKRVMHEGEHYGTIPGCGDKKTLLQPGAQKLTMTFRLAPEYEIQEVNLERGHKEYRVICTLKSIQSGTFVGQGVGCCSSMESKYRYRGGTRLCPNCGKAAIIKGKAEYGGGWVCFVKKGGCGAKWADGAPEIESQSSERQENPDPADTFNTVLKIAKKRAFVDATITATAASDIFTQDIGDDEGGTEEPPPPAKPAPPAAKEKPKQTPVKPKDKAANATNEESTQEKAAKPALLAELRKLCGGFEPEIVRYFQNVPNKSNVIMLAPFEALENLRSAVLRTLINQWDKAFPAMELWCKEHPAKPEGKPEGNQGEDWRNVIVPIPRKGMKRDEYLKNPDTIGSLYDAAKTDEASRNRLWYFAEKYEVERTWKNTEGKEVPSSPSSIKIGETFRAGLDAFIDWHDQKVDAEAKAVEAEKKAEAGEDSDVRF